MDLWLRQAEGRWHWRITDSAGEVMEASKPNGHQNRNQAIRDGQKRFPLWRDNSEWELIESGA